MAGSRDLSMTSTGFFSDHAVALTALPAEDVTQTFGSSKRDLLSCEGSRGRILRQTPHRDDDRRDSRTRSLIGVTRGPRETPPEARGVERQLQKPRGGERAIERRRQCKQLSRRPVPQSHPAYLLAVLSRLPSHRSKRG
ncbi:hypothetical protein MRX96_002863 [Rhipicephalus microplus]